jgi:fructose-1,6-bisphosphatase/inositol monophosphatase family enzyme
MSKPQYGMADDMSAMEAVAKEVSKEIIDYKGKSVYDSKLKKGEYQGESIIDQLAYAWTLGALEKYMPNFRGQILTETRPLQDIKKPGENDWLYLRIDECDGTTNAKRFAASPLPYTPSSCVSLALCADKGINSILIGTVHDMHNGNTFSGAKLPDRHWSFVNEKILKPRDFADKKGDDKYRVMVIGYSNGNNGARIKKAELEQKLWDNDIFPYEGSRASTIDILNIVYNQFDAYIDARALWPGSGAMLHPYDVAGVIPIVQGCGLEVSDMRGKPLEGNKNDLDVLVCRPVLKKRLVDLLGPVLDSQQKEANEPKAV